MKNEFEAVFDAFVTVLGGQVIPEGSDPNRRTADYWFRKYDIVAELKSLIVDQSEDTNKRLGKIIEQRLAANQHESSGRPQLEDHPSQFRLLSCEPTRESGEILLRGIRSNGTKFALAYDEKIQKAWKKVLLNAIENIIRDANNQIRDTKERLNIPSANGVVLIFNESNRLHTTPQHFAALACEVIQKPKSEIERRFPYV